MFDPFATSHYPCSLSCSTISSAALFNSTTGNHASWAAGPDSCPQRLPIPPLQSPPNLDADGNDASILHFRERDHPQTLGRLAPFSPFAVVASNPCSPLSASRLQSLAFYAHPAWFTTCRSCTKSLASLPATRNGLEPFAFFQTPASDAWELFVSADPCPRFKGSGYCSSLLRPSGLPPMTSTLPTSNDPALWLSWFGKPDLLSCAAKSLVDTTEGLIAWMPGARPAVCQSRPACLKMLGQFFVRKTLHHS